MNEVLRDLLIRMLQGDASVALARWFAGAAKRMTPLARKTESFTLLLFTAGSILGGRKIEEINVTLDMFDALTQYPVQSIKRVTFWGALTTRGLHLRPKRHAGYQPVETPLTNPILLEARPENGKRILVQVSPGQTAFVPLAAGLVALRTLARDLLTFRPRADAARAKDVRVARPGESVDVLILHGLSLDLATYLKELFESLGISAALPLELSSLGLSQDAKIDHYIKNSRLSLVVVSFDEEEPGSKKARPNVYDELMRCRHLVRDDAILLQEFRYGKPVDWPSNVIGQMVVFPFDQTALHRLIPPLIRELRARNLFAIKSVSSDSFATGDIMNSFLERMNDIWDHDLDAAWDRIHGSDYEAESSLVVILDRFFQEYLGVFRALVREKVSGDTLRDRCTTALTTSKGLAVEAWRIVATAKIQNAQEESKQLPKTVPGSARTLLSQADSALRKGTRQRAPLEERMRAFREAVDLATQYLEAARGN